MTSPATDAAVVEGVDVDSLAAAVRACPAVDDLVPGGPGELAIYLPGRRVFGLQVDPDVVVIQVRSRWGVPAPRVAAQIRQAVAGLVRRRVDIVIADITDPPGAPGVPGAPADTRHSSTTDEGGRTG